MVFMQNETTIAKRLLEVIPSSMSRVRAEIRSCVPRELSVPHFRILGSIMRGRTLISEIARHHGVSQPSMSRSVDALVKRGFIERIPGARDRRQAPLRLTKKGVVIFNKITRAAEIKLSHKVSRLNTKSHEALLQGLIELERLFFPDQKAVAGNRGGKDS